ncbi:hypothetical protein [Paenibacillus agilis]|uniref:Prolyl 4-hydroxylase alpha subunit Fe(2+) 2OG dioxygenase domain-containing protein n=1 Tax=Paenibacillus agilis TaxID=3020863 RepID=A0A559J1F4_9BACL|nr:hypothetical protein [Paenibacillus agilis]TVX93720.1 hypothetical protein FPZ44_12020 [Paenibacillus agilis]
MLQSSIVYYQDPLISYYKNVASADECQQLIDLATGKLVPSVVASHNAVGLSQSRISEQASFEHASSEIVRRVTSRIEDIVCQPLSRAEPVQIVKYPFGGKVDPHYDTFDPVSPTG